MCESAKRLNNRLGVPVTILTTIVGTSIFGTLSTTEKIIWLQISTGLISVLAAALSAVHTWFNFSDIAGRHKEAASDFGKIRHNLDLFILSFNHSEPNESSRELALERFKEISDDLDAITKRAPSIPNSIYNTTKTRVAEKPLFVGKI